MEIAPNQYRYDRAAIGAPEFRIQVCVLILMAAVFSTVANAGHDTLHLLTVDIDADWPVSVGEDIVHTITMTNISGERIEDNYLLQTRDEMIVAYDSPDCDVEDTGSTSSTFDGVLIRYPHLDVGESAACTILLKYINPIDSEYPHLVIWLALAPGGADYAGRSMRIPFLPELPIVQDFDGLRHLYEWSNGPDWVRSDGWLGPLGSECDWYGVTCNEDRTRIVELNLPNNNIRDVIWQGLWLDFRSVEHIDLSGNRLTAVLSEHVRGLNARWIDLSDNDLLGPIPNGFFRSATLTYLDLSNNRFTTDIPDDVAEHSQLEVVNLAGNRLTGELPKTLGNAKRLKVLSLSSNRIGGDLSRLRLPESIEEVYLDWNHLTGGLPRSWRSLPDLAVLDVCGNILTKRIPGNFREPGEEQQLTELRVCFNSITGPPLETDEFLVDDADAYGSLASLTQNPNPEVYCDGDRRDKVTLQWSVSGNSNLDLRTDGRHGNTLRHVSGTGSLQTGGWVESGREFYLIDSLTGKIHSRQEALRSAAGCPDVLLDVQPRLTRYCSYEDWYGQRYAVKGRRWVLWDVTQTNTERVGIYINDNTNPWVVGGPAGQLRTGYWRQTYQNSSNRFTLKDEDTGEILGTQYGVILDRECSGHFPDRP